MTKIGTFWEGLAIIVLGALLIVGAKHLGVDFGNTPNEMLAGGLFYIMGGAAPNGPAVPPKA